MRPNITMIAMIFNIAGDFLYDFRYDFLYSKRSFNLRMVSASSARISSTEGSSRLGAVSMAYSIQS